MCAVRRAASCGYRMRRRFQSACGDAPSDAFLAGAIQSAARSGRFSVEAGTRAAAPFPAPLSPLAALCLRCAPDKFLLTKPNTFQHDREASVATLRWCSGSFRSAVRLPSGTSVQLHRNPQKLRFVRPFTSLRRDVPFWNVASGLEPLCQDSDPDGIAR